MCVCVHLHVHAHTAVKGSISWSAADQIKTLKVVKEKDALHMRK